MLSVEIRDRAFAAFLQGRSLAQIAAEEWAPSLRTLERLCTHEAWVQKRRTARAMALEQIARSATPELLARDTSIEGMANQAVIKSLKLYTAVLEGKASPKDLPFSPAQLARFVRNMIK